MLLKSGCACACAGGGRVGARGVVPTRCPQVRRADVGVAVLGGVPVPPSDSATKRSRAMTPTHNPLWQGLVDRIDTRSTFVVPFGREPQEASLSMCLVLVLSYPLFVAPFSHAVHSGGPPLCVPVRVKKLLVGTCHDCPVGIRPIVGYHDTFLVENCGDTHTQ